jgi:RNA polymerase sigma-70 factor (sigma-E family)
VSGDSDFDAFVAESSTSLLRSGYLLIGDRGIAEDLLQEALLRTLRRWRTAQQAPAAYTRRVMINLANDHWRARARRVSEVGLDRDRAADSTDLTDRLTLVATLRELPHQQRAVAVLRFWEGLSVSETAALLGISEGTVKSYTSRAVARMRALLSERTETT